MNLLIKQPTRRGYVEVVPFGAFDATYPHSLTRRGRVIGGGEIAPTICATAIVLIYEYDQANLRP